MSLDTAGSPSSANAMACAQYAWRYDEGGLQVHIGSEAEAYTRTSSKQLRRLVHSDYVHEVPQGTPDSYYAAQLLHYGLPPAGSVAQALQCFKSAFASLQPGYKLKVNPSMILLMKGLKAEYKSRKQMREERISHIQSELDTIAALKEEEERLKQELLILKPNTLDVEVGASAVASAVECTTRVQMVGDLQLANTTATPLAKNRLRQPVLNAIPGQEKERKRSRTEDGITHKGSGEPAEKKARRAEPPGMALTGPHDRPASIPTRIGDIKRLAARFHGSWQLRDSSGKEFSGKAEPCITIKRYDRRGRTGFELMAYVGWLQLEGLTAYIVAKDLTNSSYIIGPCLKTTFRCVTRREQEAYHQEGSLDIFFDGSTSRIDGYLSGSSLSRPIAFRGALRITKAPWSQAKLHPKVLWDAYHSELNWSNKGRKAQGLTQIAEKAG